MGDEARAERDQQEKTLATLKEEVAAEARKASKEADKRARKERRKASGQQSNHRRALWGWGAAILLVAAGLGYARFANSSNSAGGPNDTQVVTNGAVPSTKAASPLKKESPLTASGPPSDPFQGTPADQWPDGTAGIVIPAGKSIGEYSAAQVQYAYQTTKQLLVAAALNKQTLDGGAPTAFTDLLTQDQKSMFVSQLDKIGLAKDGYALSSRGWIMSFAPGTTKLIGSVIKVHGSMSAVATKDPGGYPILRVSANYLVAYPVEPPSAPSDWMRIVTQFRGTIDFGNWKDATTDFQPWWDMGIGIAGARCGTTDGYVHPYYPAGPAQSVQPSGPAQNPYSLNNNVSGNGCHATTGT
jgi:hypothetical protein